MQRHTAMPRINIFFCFAALACVTYASAAKEVTKLQIGVKHKPSTCEQKAKAGDTVAVHYSGALIDGTVFDSSYTRGDPIKFTLGKGQVIKGWDQGIAGMCIGEKRKLQIPSHLGYGDRGSPPKIPGKLRLPRLLQITAPDPSLPSYCLKQEVPLWSLTQNLSPLDDHDKLGSAKGRQTFVSNHRTQLVRSMGRSLGVAEFPIQHTPESRPK